LHRIACCIGELLNFLCLLYHSLSNPIHLLNAGPKVAFCLLRRAYRAIVLLLCLLHRLIDPILNIGKRSLDLLSLRVELWIPRAILSSSTITGKDSC
jgi:hypothetical protein